MVLLVFMCCGAIGLDDVMSRKVIIYLNFLINCGTYIEIKKLAQNSTGYSPLSKYRKSSSSLPLFPSSASSNSGLRLRNASALGSSATSQLQLAKTPAYVSSDF